MFMKYVGGTHSAIEYLAEIIPPVYSCYRVIYTRNGATVVG